MHSWQDVVGGQSSQRPGSACRRVSHQGHGTSRRSRPGSSSLGVSLGSGPASACSGATSATQWRCPTQVTASQSFAPVHPETSVVRISMVERDGAWTYLYRGGVLHLAKTTRSALGSHRSGHNGINIVH